MHGSHPPPYGSDGPSPRARRPVDRFDLLLLLTPVVVVLLGFALAKLL